MDPFIDDGQETTAGISEVPGLHAGMEFTFRPYHGSEGSREYRKILVASSRDEKRGDDKLFKALASRIKSWNLDRELTRANMKKLNGALFEKLYLIVFMQMAPDYTVENGERKEVDEDDAENAQKN